MPTYEYKCESCGYRFDFFQKMTDTRLEVCPKCGCHVKRLIGAGAGIIFKGSGFYCTDYKSKSPETGKMSKPGELVAGHKSAESTSSAHTSADSSQK